MNSFLSRTTVEDVISWLPFRVKSLIKSNKLRVVQSASDLPNDLQQRGAALFSTALADTKHLDMSHEARMERADAMGFDTSKVWYHGGFSNFSEFDPNRSGSGGFNFASSESFARDYATTRSQDEAGDYDIVVRPFYLPKLLFDFNDKAHLKALEAELPDSLSIKGNYGWSAWGDAYIYSKAELMETIQGISIPYTGLDEQAIDDIRSGKKTYRREGGIEYVINYDRVTDVVEYAPLWAMDAINGLKGQIAFMEKEQPGYFEIPLKKLELKRKEESLRTYKMELSPQKRSGFDNWEILESQELMPYLIKIGFDGALMQERRKETATVFRNAHIRLTDAAFDQGDAASGNIHYSKALSGIQALYDDINDQLYLIADRLNKKNIMPVLKHELFHRAEAIDDRLKVSVARFHKSLQESFNLAAQGIGSSIEINAYTSVMKARTPLANQLSEYKAYIVTEYNQRPTGIIGALFKSVRNFYAAIRAALLRAGMPLKHITPADLSALAAYGARNGSRSNITSHSERHSKNSADSKIESIVAQYASMKGAPSREEMIEGFRQYYEVQNKFFDPDGAPKSGAMLAPNGESTKLNKMQWLQVRTKNFKKWFGDWLGDPDNASQALDVNGEPEIFYHGTQGDFSEFSKELIKSRHKSYTIAFHFTNRTHEASVYAHGEIDNRKPPKAGGNVMPVFLRASKPLARVTELTAASMDIDLNCNEISKQLIAAEKNGDSYDSVIAKTKRTDEWGGSNIVVFNANQIKSAIGNVGTFSEQYSSLHLSFAGENAKTADLSLLSNAKQQIHDGIDAEVVRKETGWHKGKDDRWRFEIDDSGARLKKPFPAKGQLFGDIHYSALEKQIKAGEFKGIKLGDILEHPVLFDAYPALKDIALSTQKSNGASLSIASSVNPATLSIGESEPMSKVLSLLLHEIQHDIQNIEGFAKGGNPGLFDSPEMNNHLLQSFQLDEVKAITDKADKLLAEGKHSEAVTMETAAGVIAQHRAYERLAGEVEARNTQSRLYLTEEERRMTPISATADIQDNDVIILLDNNDETFNRPSL